MNKEKMAFGLLLIPLVAMTVYGASKGYEELTLNHAEKAWNHTNEKIANLKESLSEEEQQEKDNFCFLVETKKQYEKSITESSLKRYNNDCLGL